MNSLLTYEEKKTIKNNNSYPSFEITNSKPVEIPSENSPIEYSLKSDHFFPPISNSPNKFIKTLEERLSKYYN